MFHCLLGSIPALVMALAGFSAPVSAWQLSDRQAYNKMALLTVILEGAKQRAEADDLETLRLVMSIGNDVTELYCKSRPAISRSAMPQWNARRLLRLHRSAR